MVTPHACPKRVGGFEFVAWEVLVELKCCDLEDGQK